MIDLPRCSGILLHVTSLPSPYGIGDLGAEAYRFADWLVETRQTLWQVLPLVPVSGGGSPYSSPSTFAGNPLLISPDLLHRDGLLTDRDLADTPDFPRDRLDYDDVGAFKEALLQKAFKRFEHDQPAELTTGFEQFCRDQAHWLDDYALFMALKEAHGGVAWTDWEPELIHREPDPMARARRKHARTVRMHQFWQYLFHTQWQALKAYCNNHGLRIFGDLPIYVAHDSADVWADQDLFYLDDLGRPTLVAGVPPDYFSETGQRWGNPIYRWDRMRKTDYAWWTRRLQSVLDQVDIVRLDHFRGFEAFWAIPASEPTAVNGEWMQGPGAPFFETIRKNLGKLPIVAEDLGIITDEVRDLMAQFEFPGMAVLQFAFGGDDDSPFLPHNFKKNVVAYTGTHDNDTTIGWWTNPASTLDPAAVARERAHVRRYFDLTPDREAEINWIAIQAVIDSVAHITVFPMQDVLGLGSEARMNTPGSIEGNWSWRYDPDLLTRRMTERLRSLTEAARRDATTLEKGKVGEPVSRGAGETGNPRD